MPKRIELPLVIGVLAVAALLRFLWLDVLPPGWHHDEGLMGVMASEVYRGIQRPIFFPGYTGQEPLYIYLVSGVMALLRGNEDILPVRLTSAVVGLATVYVAYLMAKEMFGRRVGVLTAALVATSFWQVMSSRNGYRSITQPLLEGAAIYLLWRARRGHSTWWYVAAGAAAAGATYTYLGGRSFPAVLVIFGLWSLLCYGRPSPATRRRLFALGMAAVVVALPIYLYWLTHPGSYSARMDQVFILNPAVNQGDPLFYIRDSLSKALQLFTIRGEMLWRYNLPGRPVFEWALAPAFYIGLAVVFRRVWRRDAASALLVIWMIVMLFPSILSWDVGGYTLRGMGLVPALFAFPAIGIIAVWDWLGRTVSWRALRIAAPCAIAAIVVFDAGLTYRDYFLDWSQQFAAAFEGDAHVVAQARYLAAEAHPDREDVFAGSEYGGHAVISHLAPNVYHQLRWFDGSQSVVYSPNLDRNSLYVLSFTTMPANPIDRYFPPEALVAMQRFDKGIIVDQPPPKFVAYRLTPNQVRSAVDKWLADPASTRATGNFGGAVELLAVQVPTRVIQGESLPITAVWRILQKPASDDYMFFTHLLDNQAVMWAQNDRNGYPTLEWQPGDIVVGRYDLSVPKNVPPGKYTVDFGLYDRNGTRRVPRVDAPDQSTSTITTLKVVSAQPVVEQSMKNLIDKQVGDKVKLLGYNVDRGTGPDGKPALDTTLLWSALGKPAEDYTVFVQLLSPEGKLVAQSDAMPSANRFPTSIWEPGDIIADTHRLTLAPGLPSGQYRLIAGLYQLATGTRLPAEGGGDYVTLGEVALPDR